MLKTLAIAGLAVLLVGCSAVKADNTSEVCANAELEVVTMMELLDTSSSITTQAGMKPMLDRVDKGGENLIAISQRASNIEVQALISTMGSSFKNYAVDGRTTMAGGIDEDRTQAMNSRLIIAVTDTAARCGWTV